MKTFQLTIVLLIAATLEACTAIAFDWHPEANVEIPANAVVHPPAMRRMQTTAEVSSEASASASSASAASSAPETDMPTTIMVLLPDILAPSYSGSGSTMFFDGSVGGEDENKSAGSGTAKDETSAAASGLNFGLAMVTTASTVLSGYLLMV